MSEEEYDKFVETGDYEEFRSKMHIKQNVHV